MNRLEFFSKLQEFENNHKNTLKHSNGRDFGYYAKIDKYYPDGTPRYFYTKEQWDAYQKGLELSKKAKQHNDELAKKEKIEKQQKETFEKNKAADNARKLEERKKNDPNWQKQQDDTFKKNETAAKAQDIEQQNRDFAKKKENNPQMLNKNGDWRDDKGQDDMGWVMFDERNSNVPNYLSRLARGASISESFQKEFDNYIDSRYNKKEAKQFRELFQDVLKDQDNIKDQIIKDPNFTDAINKLKNKEGRITESDSEEIEKLVRALYKRYSQKSKYKDYYWQDSQYFASGGMLMGWLRDGVWNKIVDELKNTVLKDRNYKK